MLTDIQDWFRRFINSPGQVATWSLLLLVFALLLDGSVFQYWTLVGEYDRLNQAIETQHIQTKELSHKIKEAKGLEYVEYQARDRLDLVNNDELVFVFSEESDDSSMAQ